MSDNIIEVSGLTKRYGSLTAVDSLSFGIGRGRIYGFLGPNGAGKSTTMNMMTGYLAPSEGTVTVNGHDIYKEPDLAKKSIGYLPEIPPLYTDMTVDEYLIFVAELKGIRGTDKRKEADRSEERAGLTEVKGRLIGNLSKGFRQRAGVAQALIGSPDVIILDEPTVGLDPRQIIEIRTLIKDLGRDHTVILSSHILSEVAAVCDTLMIISRGRLVADGTPEELRKLSGGVTLEIAAKADSQRINKIIEGLPGIKETSKLVLENEDVGASGITITMEDGARDIREDLFRRFSEANVPLIRLSRTEQTLEDVFLKLTSEEAAGQLDDANKDLDDASPAPDDVNKDQDDAPPVPDDANEDLDGAALAFDDNKDSDEAGSSSDNDNTDLPDATVADRTESDDTKEALS